MIDLAKLIAKYPHDLYKCTCMYRLTTTLSCTSSTTFIIMDKILINNTNCSNKLLVFIVRSSSKKSVKCIIEIHTKKGKLFEFRLIKDGRHEANRNDT